MNPPQKTTISPTPAFGGLRPTGYAEGDPAGSTERPSAPAPAGATPQHATISPTPVTPAGFDIHGYTGMGDR